MLKKWTISVSEFADQEPRTLYIYLPSSYYRKTRKRYPVLYMFDGHNLFSDSDATYGKSWGLKEYLDHTKTEIIVVALECSHQPNQERLREYSPFTFHEDPIGTIYGRGRTTMNWYAYTLKKKVDQHFRTLRDREHTYIAGSSMGGLMSIYALLSYGHIYSRAAALSPSLWVEPDKIQALIDEATIYPNTMLYLDYGTEEFRNHEGMKELFVGAVYELQQKNICVTSRMVPNGTHSEASWEKQLPFIFHTLLYQI